MHSVQGFIQDFTLEGGYFFGIVNMYVKQTLCKSCPSRGHAPPPEKNSCPETESGGFWQLADYLTLVFKITAF